MEKMKSCGLYTDVLFSVFPSNNGRLFSFPTNLNYNIFFSVLSVPAAINLIDINAVTINNASKNFQMPKRQL